MNLDRLLLAFAGVMILISLALTAKVHANFVWLTVFIAVNLIQASFTGFCPAAAVFKKLGVKTGSAFK